LLAGNMREASHLRRNFLSRHLDLLHVNVHGYEMAGIAARLARIPVLAMCLTYPKAESQRSRRLLIKYALRAYSHVTSQSKACTEAWVRYASLCPAHCSWVWNSADESFFRAGEERVGRARSAGTLRVVAVGRLHPMKGFAYLIRAMGELRDLDVRLRIVGEGEQCDELSELAVSLDLTERVCLWGHDEDVIRHLREADVMVLPSVALESGPAAVAEAMAAGLPVVTSDFGPLAEMNVDGVTGVVVPAADAAALAAALRRLATEPQLTCAMGRAAHARARECFRRQAMITKTMGLYDAVTSGF
jgi:glycosyltransferase involved in cell wall biosynthesis